jgi:hypothetical protein
MTRCNILGFLKLRIFKFFFKQKNPIIVDFFLFCGSLCVEFFKDLYIFNIIGKLFSKKTRKFQPGKEKCFLLFTFFALLKNV